MAVPSVSPVGCRLKRLRSDAHMTLEELSGASGCTLSELEGYESGTLVLCLDVAYKLASALGCTPNDICGFGDADRAAPEMARGCF